MNDINIKTGLKTFRINFSDRDVSAEISFNPSDSELSNRLFKAQKMIEKKAEEIKEFSVDENGMPDIDEYIKYTDDINQSVYDAVDYAFGNKISDKVFAYCSPFAVVDGKYFIITFFEQIAPVIRSIVEKDGTQASEEAQKYINKYKKALK